MKLEESILIAAKGSKEPDKVEEEMKLIEKLDKATSKLVCKIAVELYRLVKAEVEGSVVKL
jgi:hypothetical protein